jgi:GT2 family glycosyltransferase
VRAASEPRHLESCLSSLDEQSYPQDRFEVTVLERFGQNSRAQARAQHPRIGIERFDRDRGLSAVHNEVIQASTADFVVLLDSRLTVSPDWLACLASSASRAGAAAVASRIVQSEKSADNRRLLDCDRERRVLFADRSAGLFDRRAFLDVGGFDEDFFEECEDIDLGWRLNLVGCDVVLMPKAVARRQAGNAGLGGRVPRLRLRERNALSAIFKNCEKSTLERVLPVAVALSLLRGMTGSGIEELTFDLWARPPVFVDVSPELVAHLLALEDFSQQLPVLRRKRERVQRSRKRKDEELFDLLGEWWLPNVSGMSGKQIERLLLRDLGVDEVSDPRRQIDQPRRADALDRSSVGAGTWRIQPNMTPMVSIIILTALGPKHLPECLSSLRAQTYPADRIEVIVVDNGSIDDPTSVARLHYPGVQVIRNATNIGFAAGNNAGASVATGDCLVFLNDDTRTDPEWLSMLVATAKRRRAAAVASCILDWSGERVDFIEGAVNFQGKGFQLHYGAPTTSLVLEEKQLLFACGCAMLVDRTSFENAGRWDESAFAFYEDVELGWRLNLLGHQIWLAPRAIVYHKHHGTSGQWPEPPRQRLYERNALRTIYRLLDDRSLRHALPAALLLAADRALLATEFSRAQSAKGLSTLVGSVKSTLRSHGVTRATPILHALGQVGPRGALQTVQRVVTALTGRPSRSRREYYLREFDTSRSRGVTQPARLPIESAAVLSGVYGFLTDLPRLSKLRAAIQDERIAADSDILGRFADSWLYPSQSRFQAVHDVVHRELVDEFELAAITRPVNHPV